VQARFGEGLTGRPVNGKNGLPRFLLYIYTIPVAYHREGAVLHIISWRDGQWWRNLRGEVPVMLRLQGHDLQGGGNVLEDDEDVN
jgi:hypothetical protein